MAGLAQDHANRDHQADLAGLPHLNDAGAGRGSVQPPRIKRYGNLLTIYYAKLEALPTNALPWSPPRGQHIYRIKIDADLYIVIDLRGKILVEHPNRTCQKKFSGTNDIESCFLKMKSVALEWQKSAPDPTRPSAVGPFVREPVPGPVAVVQVYEDEAASDPDSSEADSSLSDDSQATLPLDALRDFPDVILAEVNGANADANADVDVPSDSDGPDGPVLEHAGKRRALGVPSPQRPNSRPAWA